MSSNCKMSSGQTKCFDATYVAIFLTFNCLAAEDLHFAVGGS